MKKLFILLASRILVIMAVLGSPLIVLGDIETSVVELDYVGSTLWTSMHDVVVVGEHAYCAVQYGLLILDISDPSVPVEAGRLYLGESCVDLEIQDEYAYIVTDRANFLVVDISDISSPTLVRKNIYNGSLGGIAVEGEIAYIFSDYSLRALDISNPLDPVMLGTRTISSQRVDIDVADGIVFAACKEHGVIMYDLTDPEHPGWYGRYESTGDIVSVSCESGQVFVAVRGVGIELIDVSDPDNVALVASYPTSETPADLYVTDNRVHVATYGSGYVGINVSDPYDPVYAYASGVPMENLRSTDVFYAGGYAFLVGETYAGSSIGGLQIIDLSDIENPAFVSHYDLKYQTMDVVVSGDYAFVANGFDGISIVDLSDRANPVPIGSFHQDGYARELWVEGDWVFSAGGSHGVTLTDVSDINNPVVVSHLNNSGPSAYANDICVVGDIAYTANITSEGLQLFDISDRYNPTLIADSYVGEDPQAVYVSGDYAYIADNWYGLKIVDVSVPTAPEMVAQIDLVFVLWYDSLADYVMDVVVDGNYAYLACRLSGLTILDVSDPSAPIFLSKKGKEGTDPDIIQGRAVRKSGNIVWLAGRDKGVQVFDVTDPAHPSRIAYYETPGDAENIATDGFYGYATDEGGMIIFESPTNSNCCGLYSAGYSGNVDNSTDGLRNLADVTRLIDRVYLGKSELECEENGNVDGDEDGSINLADITRLIDHVYISKEETAYCQ